MPSTSEHRAAARLIWARQALNDPCATLASASSDASFRSYWRTHDADGRSLIVMDAPPPEEDVAPWLDIGQRLRQAGLNAPEVFAQDPENGFLLIADFGDKLYLPALDDSTVDTLYGDAMHALLRMQVRVDAGDLPLYDEVFLRREMQLIIDWFIRQYLGQALDDAENAVIQAAFDTLIASALEQPYRFVHRDYHSRNLLIVPPDLVDVPAGMLASPGIIDFQGAMLGPITYDLASLLRDCYIPWDETRVCAWVGAYHAQLREAGLIDDDIDVGTFQRWFDLMGLQRHIKVLGIFCRLALRDGKQAYLADLPRVLCYVLAVSDRYRELAEFADLLRRCVGDIENGRVCA